MKKTFIPKRFVIACNKPINWDWDSLISEFAYYENIQDLLLAIFNQNYLEGWNKHKRNFIFQNSENQFFRWICGLNENYIKNSLKNSSKLREVTLKAYIKQQEPKYDFIALVKNKKNEMGLMYIGDKFLIPDVHLKIESKFFAMASLFSENFDLDKMPIPFMAGKMLYKNFNLPKAFHEYHKKIYTIQNQFFTIGIDYKNRVLDYEKNQPMFIYHWAENQKFIERKSHNITGF